MDPLAPRSTKQCLTISESNCVQMFINQTPTDQFRMLRQARMAHATCLSK